MKILPLHKYACDSIFCVEPSDIYAYASTNQGIRPLYAQLAFLPEADIVLEMLKGSNLKVLAHALYENRNDTTFEYHYYFRGDSCGIKKGPVAKLKFK